MKVCECGEEPKHHPSVHFARKRDALMEQVKEFMDTVYPTHIFGETFNRRQVELVAACFVLREEAREL
jgi:hypothetical protein